MFTRQQIEEIKKKLFVLGKSDSQFEKTNNLDRNDFFAVVKDGENKKISVNDFVDSDGFSSKLQEVLPERQVIYENCTFYGTGDDITIESDPETGRMRIKNRTLADGGMGYIILEPNKSFVNQIGQEDTIYEVRYNFTVTDASIDFPANSVLYFNGGSLKNEDGTTTLVATEEAIYSSIVPKEKTLDNVTLTGNWVYNQAEPIQMDKQYDPANFSGMGKVYLKKNITTIRDLDGNDVTVNLLTQDAFLKDDGEGGRVPNTNTVFVVDSDFSLGTSKTSNLTIQKSHRIDITSPERMLVLTGGTNDDNDVYSTEINGTTYYYKPIDLAPYRTFTLMDNYEWYSISDDTPQTNTSPNPCVLLNKNGDDFTVSADTSITADSEGTTIYVAVTEQGYYYKSYTISVPYYYATVTPPAGTRLEILDFSKCVFLTAERDNISFDRTYDDHGLFVVYDGHTSLDIATAYPPSKFINNEALSITIENAYRITTDSVITIPEDCALVFDGGSIKDGAIVGTDTRLYAEETPIFTNVIFNGSWLCPKIYSKWFSEAGTVDNIVKQLNRLQSSSFYNDIFISPGDYWETPRERDVDKQLFGVKSNSKLYLYGNLRVRPNNVTYRTLGIVDAHDIVITGGGSVYGDKTGHIYPDWNCYPEGKIQTYYNSNNDTAANVTINDVTYNLHDLDHTQTDSTYEGSHCVDLRRGTNITVDGIHIYDAIGDGIFVNGTASTGFNTIKNCTIYNTRRQGISAVVDNLNIENVTIEKVFGTAPSAGIDVEANSSDATNYKCINIKDVTISDTIIGVELWTQRYQQTGIIKISNVRTPNVGFPLSTSGRGYLVDIENCSFSAKPKRGYVLDKTLGILRWSNTSDRFSSFKDMYATIKNCVFSVSDYDGDRYLLDCVSNNNAVSDKLYVDIDGCIFNAINSNGIRFARGFTLRNSRVYAKSITCTADISSTYTKSFLENNYIEAKILSLSNALVDNNRIVMSGPIIGGSLHGNEIFFANMPEDYSALYALPDIVVSEYVGNLKYLIRTYQQTSVEGNRISANTPSGYLDALFFCGSTATNRGNRPNISNNEFVSSNNSQWINIRYIPIATKGTATYLFAYIYNNKFEHYKLAETKDGKGTFVASNSAVTTISPTVAPDGTTVYPCAYSIASLTTGNDYIIEYQGDVQPDGVLFEAVGTGEYQYIPWGMDSYNPKVTSGLRLYWADGYHVDGVVSVYRRTTEIKEVDEDWEYTQPVKEVPTAISTNTVFTAGTELTKAQCYAALGISDTDFDAIFNGEIEQIRYGSNAYKISNITVGVDTSDHDIFYFRGAITDASTTTGITYRDVWVTCVTADTTYKIEIPEPENENNSD